MGQMISEAYRQEQVALHRNPNYGIASVGFAMTVKKLFEGVGAKSISDYGAGKCRLREALHDAGVQAFDYFPYDPAYPEYGEPRPADLVTCIDVLEHIEEPYLDNVLRQLQAITLKRGFFTVHCGPAQKLLSDGRNAHLIQAPSSWWLPRLCEYFEVTQLQTNNLGFVVVVEPKQERTA